MSNKLSKIYNALSKGKTFPALYKLSKNILNIITCLIAITIFVIIFLTSSILTYLYISPMTDNYFTPPYEKQERIICEKDLWGNLPHCILLSISYTVIMIGIIIFSSGITFFLLAPLCMCCNKYYNYVREDLKNIDL